MDDRFFTAYFPGEARVCGRKLKDFTPFHYLLLRALNSPFMDVDGIITVPDLLAAVNACRKYFGGDVEMRSTIKDSWWSRRMRRNPHIFHRECRKFSEWMSAHSSGPRFWNVVSGGQKTRDLTGPDVLTLLVPLMMKTNISEKDAWNMSLGRAQWMNAEIAELEGSERRFLFDSDFDEIQEEPEVNHA